MRKVYFLLALAVCCSLFSNGFFNPESAGAQITGASFVCGQNAVTHMMNISNGQVLSGKYLLQAYANPYVSGFPDSKIAKLEFKTMGNGLIANALPSTSTIHEALWNTTALPDGVYQIFAHAYWDVYAVPIGSCTTDPVTVTIKNNVAPDPTSSIVEESLSLELSQKYWEGPTNVWVKFAAKLI